MTIVYRFNMKPALV